MKLFFITVLAIALVGCSSLPPVSGSSGLTQANRDRVIVGKTTQPQLEAMLGRGTYLHPSTWTSVTHDIAYQIPSSAKHIFVYDRNDFAFNLRDGTNKRTRFAVLLDSRGVVIRKAFIRR